jgi:glycosyltransferase involved in cell wall biosynthesis
MSKKHKVLVLSDHALSTSGVGCQSRYLIEGLIRKGRWSFRQFGAAIQHANYDTVKVSDDFIIKPIDGFGNRELMMQAIVTEKPDAILLFTDPRFFLWFYEIEDEIRQVCPVAYWHVWDNYPMPTYNLPIYEATDLINCHSHMTYTMIKEHFPEKTNFIPHALPDNVFYVLDDKEIKHHKSSLFGKQNKDAFVLFWVNRNARRKRPGDLMWAWKKFINRIENEGVKHQNAILCLHTDPNDQEGPNLLAIAEEFNISSTCFFSNQRIEFEKMNILHNVADVCINVSYAEGFGLATLEAMQCAKPIIAVKTGGLTRQVIDHRDNSVNGIGLDVDFQSCVGSQTVPFIYEDYASVDNIADAIYEMYMMPAEERKSLGIKAKDYVKEEFSIEKTIDLWDESLNKLITDHKEKPTQKWNIQELRGTKA